MTVACVLSTLEPLWGWHGQFLAMALTLVILGAIVTFVRRLALIYGNLERR